MGKSYSYKKPASSFSRRSFGPSCFKIHLRSNNRTFLQSFESAFSVITILYPAENSKRAYEEENRRHRKRRANPPLNCTLRTRHLHFE